MAFQTRSPIACRRPSLSGVSLLVLVAFALGASVSRADASLTRMEGSQDRAVLVTTVPQHRVARPQRRQEERPASASGMAGQRPGVRTREASPAGESRPSNLPCLRESLVALPPPARSH